MRKALTELLWQRYPKLYSGRDKPITQSLISFGFEHGDGWFALIDTLSSLLEPRGIAAVQVKEKFGTLSYYTSASDDFGSGAISLATYMSGRVCMFTGRPGRVVSIGGWLVCLDPYAPPEMLPERIREGMSRIREVQDEEDESAVAEDDWARARRAGQVRLAAVRLSLPAYALPLGQGLARALTKAGWVSPGQPTPPAVRAISLSAGRLSVDADGAHGHGEGALAFANALLLRLHVETGALGPVDDEGRTAWMRH
jgi:hypothetical protein